MPNIVPHRVEILTFERGQLLDLAGPAQVFATANDLTPVNAAKPYEIAIVSTHTEVTTSSGIAVKTNALPSDTDRLGTLIVAGGHGVDLACRDAWLVDWIGRRAGMAKRVSSVCTGAFLLAEAGLLNGRRAVTHWRRCAEFASRYPSVRLDPEPIFVRDDHIWTSAGVTAGIDLALAMVEADCGRALALAVARQLVVFLKRPGGQAQFSNTLVLQEADATFDKLHSWVAANLNRDLSLAALADRAGMSLRTFCRRYRQNTGRTPAEGIEMIRFEGARGHLEDGTSVARTASRCGFGSTETMRRVFLKRLGVGPNAYRDRFHG